MAIEARAWMRDVAVTGAAAVIGAVAFVGHRPVPLLDLFDLGIHEAGHLLAFALPALAMFLAGSLAQVAFPLGMAWYFHAARRDAAAAGLCLVWAGTSARHVSIYAGDAVARSLPLVGGEHDWAYILGPRGFDALEHTTAVAASIEFLGATLAVAGLSVAVGATHRTWSAGRAAPIGRGPSAARAFAADPWDRAWGPDVAGESTASTRRRSGSVWR